MYLGNSNPLDAITGTVRSMNTMNAAVEDFSNRPWGLYALGLGVAIVLGGLIGSKVTGKAIGQEVKAELRRK